MKRLFGLVGITYLAVQAAVFYFYGDAVLWLTLILSLLFAALGLALKLLKPNSAAGVRLTAAGITAFCAVSIFFLFQNNAYQSVLNDYSEKEITVSGYVCDEPVKLSSGQLFTVRTETVNGEIRDLKLSLLLYDDYGLEEFDNLSLRTNVSAIDSAYCKSKGIFLRASGGSSFFLEKKEGKHFSPYSLAVSARKAIRRSIDSQMDESEASICKAVLLGDKRALSDDVYNAFVSTGVSFLIVVSGLHLGIVVTFLSFFLRKANKWVKFAVIAAAVAAYATITGLNTSVVRSAVAVLLSYSAKLFWRKADGINSLGIAALVLAVPNPFLAGDAGALLSFSATMGILLWAEPLSKYMSRPFKRRFITKIIKAVSVSVSGTLWTAPLIIIFFGRVSPLTVIVALLLEIPTTVILAASLAASLIYMIPFVSVLAVPFAFTARCFARLETDIVSFFSKLPISSLKADMLCFYVWIAVSAVLVILCYAFHANPFYVKCATALSAVSLVASWAAGELFADDSVYLSYRASGSGMLVIVSDTANVSLAACGGVMSLADALNGELSGYGAVNSIVIPKGIQSYARLISPILAENRVSLLICEKTSAEKLEGLIPETDSLRTFEGDCMFTVSLTETASDTIICLGGSVFQYISCPEATALVFTSGSSPEKLPPQFKTADYLLTDKVGDFSGLAIGTVVVPYDEGVTTENGMISVPYGAEYVINGG